MTTPPVPLAPASPPHPPPPPPSHCASPLTTGDNFSSPEENLSPGPQSSHQANRWFYPGLSALGTRLLFYDTGFTGFTEYITNFDQLYFLYDVNCAVCPASYKAQQRYHRLQILRSVSFSNLPFTSNRVHTSQGHSFKNGVRWRIHKDHPEKFITVV